MARGFTGNRGTARRSTRGPTRRKGQIRAGKKVQYAIQSSRGNTKYIGTTNNPLRRTIEHLKAGKLGPKDKLVVQTRPISQKSAEGVETAKLASFRRKYGRNPKHNTTNNGRWHS